uniref:FtsK/SpoIIIE domain-containing protein n=1 Tax=Vaginimicrobium propionicum TaxID=1871034 RepID=UPI000970509D|nr:FtsK/SpoIIIE domain-containing protein [Vaginimicrobium propionicum]
MRIVIENNQVQRLFAVTNLSDFITLDDLISAARLDKRDWNRIWVDENEYSPHTLCADIPLLEGSLISNVRPEPNRDSRWALTVIGGKDTGISYRLPNNGDLRLGRSDEAEITLDSESASWSHALLSVNDSGVWIVDDHSSNGTWVNGDRIGSDCASLELSAGDAINIGGVTLRVSKIESSKLPSFHTTRSLSGVVAFNRPPRPALPKPPRPLEVPLKKEPSTSSRFSWVAVIAPLLMAVAMVVVMDSVRYALIALLSPMMAVGSWAEQKRRAKTDVKESEETYLVALDKLRKDIESAADKERDRLTTMIPYPDSYITDVKEAAPRLWQVRVSHSDFWQANLGTASRPWQAPLEGNSKPQERTSKVLDSAALKAAPVGIDFSSGPVGIWGERAHALGIARSLLCQTITRSGPADTTVIVLTDKARAEQWSWLTWAPHTMQSGTNPNNWLFATNTSQAESLARSFYADIDSRSGQNLFILLDDIALLESKDSPVRDLLAYQADSRDKAACRVTGLVIATSQDMLPASCHTVIEAKTDSTANLLIPSLSDSISNVNTCQISLPTASKWARGLAKFEDLELREAGAALPSLVHLFDLLGITRSSLSPTDIVDNWQRNNSFSVPLGVCEGGQFVFDLVKDGPHGLVGGTTGSGKSELLRSLIAGLAARVSPKELTFVLVDFKGGAAFASLDKLPHTIGTLSNLEAPLAYRALKALEAEMRYRQECFAQAGEGIDNLEAYLATNPKEPMPRLLVVVDEFAQLAKEFPDVLSALVSIGAVGRTLGVHMILATQRPAGVVNDDILANTNMRVALRVQSREDSANVISVPDAAAIGREQKGRAYIKLGENDISAIQTALVTGISGNDDAASLYVDEISLGQAPPEHTITASDEDLSDMDLLIEAIREAAKDLGCDAPRPVWPEPLGDSVELTLDTDTTTQSASTDSILIALADDPDKQRQYLTGWDTAEGNLLLVGIPGSGTTTALCSLALRIASTHDPADTNFLFLDLGNQGLKPLDALPHSRGYAGAGSINRELQTRTLRYLIAELDRRVASPGRYPKLFVFIDSLLVLREEYDDYEGIELLQKFYQVWLKGPAVGIFFAASSSGLRAIPSVVSEVTTQKWLFDLADPYDYSLANVPKDNIPAKVPGRFVDSLSGHHAHVATPSSLDSAISAIQQRRGCTDKPPLISKLPKSVSPASISGVAAVAAEPWLVPVGIAEHDLQTFCLEAWPGEHLLIAGPSRSGKSSVLAGIAQALSLRALESGQILQVVGIGSKRSPLLGSDLGRFVSFDDATSILAEALVATCPTLVLVDDAHLFADETGQLAALLSSSKPNLLVIAAGRSDDLRTQYGKWTNDLRKSRIGILLQPDKDRDGELMSLTLPRRAPVELSPGRGYACQAGTPILIQAVGTDL